MTFGKNRVQFDDFYWQHYDFGQFKTYYNTGGDKTARYVGLRARSIITEMEYRLDFQLPDLINFIVYNDLLDFRQSNIGLVSGNDEYNIGGVTAIANNKILVYNRGSHSHIDQQLRQAIAEIIINRILVGNSLSDRLTSSSLSSYPEWFVGGLVYYYGKEFDASVQQKIKDGLTHGKYAKLHWLNEEDAKLAGLSFWTFIAINYGEEALTDIMYMSRMTRNISNAFLFITGIPFKNLVREWVQYTNYRLSQEEKSTTPLPANKLETKNRKKVTYQNLVFSQNREFAAWNTNDQGKVKIYVKNQKTGKRKKVFTCGNRLPQITDYQYPILQWHPQLQLLTWIYENEQTIKLAFFDTETNEITERNIPYVNRILDYDFNPEVSEIVFSAVKQGQTDLFLLNLASNNQTQLSDDLPDDINPRFTKTSNIVFSSNRSTTNPDTLQSEFNIFQTGKAAYAPVSIVQNRGNQTQPQPYKKGEYLYLTDQSGISNRFYAKYDSSIINIDTTVHYRFFSNTKPLTNLNYGVNSHQLAMDKRHTFDIQFKNHHYQFFNTPVNTQKSIPAPGLTEQRAFYDVRRKFYNTQLEKLEEQQQSNDSLININNYIFEFEKRRAKKEHRWPPIEADSLWVLKRKLYATTFYTNFMVNQVDFSQLNQSYQVYTGGAVFFNPGFNVLTKFGAADLFEDYKLTAGVRLAANFTGNEYLISLENVKSRLDKQLILHRMGTEEITESENLIRSYSHQAMLVFKYPFTQVASARFTAKTRVDQIVYPAIDNATLNQPDEYRLWAGTLWELVFDNTTSPAINLYRGTRAKLFFEHYTQLERKTKNHLFVLGTDVRHYIKIHRQLIWANRFAASTSFGNALLIYYLGGVDNWMTTGQGYFDQSIPVDKSKNWAFQTVGTNMRGFQQNVRNGNSFAVINSEIRWPIIKYIVNRPLNISILDHFMVIGFFDVGSAWYGWDITDKDNFYRYDYIENGPVSVRIDKQRDPLVAGYGFGARTRFFGYYFRLDWAWGIENMQVLDRMFYLSINLDF
ncbi:MAG: hypothetical protein PF489_07470 [Salinivirgaceae bacterium]|jgi:hypothetical protein|nr:hypothetical protein [Salinivirgaceae bacterium]